MNNEYTDSFQQWKQNRLGYSPPPEMMRQNFNVSDYIHNLLANANFHVQANLRFGGEQPPAWEFETPINRYLQILDDIFKHRR